MLMHFERQRESVRVCGALMLAQPLRLREVVRDSCALMLAQALRQIEAVKDSDRLILLQADSEPESVRDFCRLMLAQREGEGDALTEPEAETDFDNAEREIETDMLRLRKSERDSERLSHRLGVIDSSALRLRDLLRLRSPDTLGQRLADFETDVLRSAEPRNLLLERDLEGDFFFDWLALLNTLGRFDLLADLDLSRLVERDACRERERDASREGDFDRLAPADCSIDWSTLAARQTLRRCCLKGDTLRDLLSLLDRERLREPETDCSCCATIRDRERERQRLIDRLRHGLALGDLLADRLAYGELYQRLRLPVRLIEADRDRLALPMYLLAHLLRERHCDLERDMLRLWLREAIFLSP